MPCRKVIFDCWRSRLEMEPGLWNVRCPASNRVAFNAATRQFWDIKQKVIDWNHAVRWVEQHSVMALESAHSQVLKSGGVVQLDVRVKVSPISTLLVPHTISAAKCGCGRCQHAVVLILVSPL